ncbi:helix-turn-helix transcriptional regulator [Bosea sp. 2RAB26]|uniref:helix-turn-helix transcriptional regulator n=2 Tax=Pseudomonadota TaxID=1224 RepID=UPI003F93DD2E
MDDRLDQDRSSASMQLFSKRLKVSAGTFRHGRGEQVVGPMKRGLKVVVMLQGHQSYELDDRPPLTINSPMLLVAANDGDHVQKRTCLSGEGVRCAIVQLDADFAQDELGASFSDLMGQMQGSGIGPGLWARAAGADLRGIALQMAECRIEGAMRNLYMAGKALELAATVVDQIVNERPQRAARLSPRTIEQLRAAHALLLQSARNPPTLGELARNTGLNVTKLTAGFRQLYGASVFDYLQAHRLQQAYDLIRSGEKSVAEAAYHVGYNPAHFSGIFRKRFGILPSTLR